MTKTVVELPKLVLAGAAAAASSRSTSEVRGDLHHDAFEGTLGAASAAIRTTAAGTNNTGRGRGADVEPIGSSGGGLRDLLALLLTVFRNDVCQEKEPFLFYNGTYGLSFEHFWCSVFVPACHH